MRGTARLDLESNTRRRELKGSSARRSGVSFFNEASTDKNLRERNDRGDSRLIANDACRVALTGEVFSQIDVAGSEAVDRTVAQTDLDFARQGDHKLSARSRVPVQKITRLGGTELDAFRLL